MNKNLVDIKSLIRKNISANEYIILHCLYYNEELLINNYKKSFGKFDERLFIDLINKGYILPNKTNDYYFNKLVLTDKFENEILNNKEDVDSWIIEWYNLWPTGVKSGGYPVRSDKPACLKKMKKFINNNSYTKDQIFQATINYLNKCKENSYYYIRLAPYFIEKLDISLLGRECELLIIGKEEVNVDFKDDI